MVCDRCAGRWSDDHAVCPHDGTRLSSELDLASSPTVVAHQSVSGNEDLPAGTLAGEYRIIEKIGEGGMGCVYGAVHPVIGKRAAIKVIQRQLSSNPEAVERFIREAQSVNRIGDPNIVDVFGFGELDDGRHFFVMEWLQGESLRERLLRPLPLHEALDTLETVARALEAAHVAGVVHRDLKPDNVFIARGRGEPQIKLLDFGLAKLSGASEGGMTSTRSGAIMGTPQYISPEQAKGLVATAASDIYSLGVIAFEMVAGVVPFQAESAVELMAKHISAPVPSLADIAPWTPPALQQLIHWMLQKEAPQRPGIHELRAQLASCKTDLSATPSTPTIRAVTPGELAPTTPLPGEPKRSRSRWVAAIACVTVLGAGATAYALWDGDREPPAAAPADPPAVAMVAKSPPETLPPIPTPVPPPPSPPVELAKPPVASPPAARRSTLAIEITGRTRAKISVDGKLVGKNVARVKLEVAPGEHVVRAVADRRKPADATVHVPAGARRSVTLTLEPQSQTRPAEPRAGSDVNAVHDPFAD